MLDREFMVLLDAYRRLIRRNAHSNLGKMISKTHSADLAAVFRYFTDAEREMVFNLITDNSYKADLLTELDEAILLDLVKDMKPRAIAEVLKKMAPDNQADIVAQLSEEMSQKVLDLMSKADSEDIEDLMMYPPDTAGGIMVPLTFKMLEDATVQDAINAMQGKQEVEMIFYVYIVDNNDTLVGVISIRQLLTVSSSARLKDVMTTRVVTVQPETDQEEVARIISRYNFLAIPVVDNNILLGIVTVDDIIDVIREEATEDFLQMAGAGKDREILLKSPIQSVKIRFPWLFATFIGGIVLSLIVMGFKTTLDRFLILAAFMPVIAGMGGNVGTQSSTIVVRGLATGRINVKQILKVILKQMKIGIILGVAYGIFLAAFAVLFYHSEVNIPMIGLVIGISLTIAMFLAATVGTLTPMLLHRFNIDPAVATGPLVTTIDDIIGVLVYFTIASVLLF